MTTTLCSSGYSFSIPAKGTVSETVDASDVMLDIDSFTQWLEELPSANVESVAIELSLRLHTLNQDSLNPSQYLQLLQLIHPFAEQSMDALLEKISGQSFPLREEHLQAVIKLESLTQELADAYLLSVNALVNNQENPDLSLVDNALFMAMYCLNRQLYQCYLLYRETPEKIWQNMHQLCKCAADFSLLHKHTADEESDPYSTRYQTEALYKKSLLLHLAGPHRLRQSDIVMLDKILDQCSEYSILRNSKDMSCGKTGFCIVLDKDIALLPLVADISAGSKNIYYFSAVPLAKLISHRIHSPQEENIFRALSVDTCKRLMLSWGVLSKRLFTRKTSPVSDKKLVAAGITNTHYYLNNEELFIEQWESKKTRSSISSSTPNVGNILEGRDLWEKIHTSPGASDFFAPDEKVVMQSSSARSFPSHLWEVVNESAGGYCLRSRIDTPGYITVGDLVSLKTMNNIGNSDWEIGVIRWIKYLLENEMEIGVQMIAPSAHALAISGSKGKNQLTSRAFLIPDIRAIKQPATIITPSLPYTSGDIIDLLEGDKAERVKLLNMTDDTGKYRQFEFKRLGRQARAE